LKGDRKDSLQAVLQRNSGLMRYPNFFSGF
jgi:hypothetical protein